MSDQEKFARALGKLLAFAQAEGIKVLMYQLFRTEEQQHELFLAGKSNADGKKKLSYHQLGRAADIAVMKENSIIWPRVPEYEHLGEYWKSLGGTWGGDFKAEKVKDDIYHFQM